jgi:hypothetical protein
MNRKPHFRTVLVIATVLALGTASVAGARPLQAPQATRNDGVGWFAAALRWLEHVAGVPRLASDRQDRSEPPATKEKPGDITPTGGSCVDPQGNPRPWCL